MVGKAATLILYICTSSSDVNIADVKKTFSSFLLLEQVPSAEHTTSALSLEIKWDDSVLQEIHTLLWKQNLLQSTAKNSGQQLT